MELCNCGFQLYCKKYGLKKMKQFVVAEFFLIFIFQNLHPGDNTFVSMSQSSRKEKAGDISE